MNDIKKYEFVIFCDGGVGNRLNALISGLAIAKKFKLTYCVCWPTNNWCQAEFKDVINLDAAVFNIGISDLSGVFCEAAVLLHDDIASSCLQVDFNSAYSYKSLIDFKNKVIDGFDVIFYYPALIPEWLPSVLIKAEIENLNFNEKIMQECIDFIRNFIGGPYYGIHLRRTDLNVGLSDEEVIKLCRRNPNIKFFVCSDDPVAESLPSSFSNVYSRKKKSYVSKRNNGEAWISRTTDDDGRISFGNIVRSREAVIEGVVDLLILAHSRIVGFSGSTFQKLAGMLGEAVSFTDINKPSPIQYISSSEVKRQINAGLLKPADIIEYCRGLILQGDVDDAILIMEDAISKFPENEILDLLHTLGIFHLNEKRARVAALYFGEVVKTDPAAWRSWLHLCFVNYLLKNKEMCIHCFDHFLKYKPAVLNEDESYLCQYLMNSDFLCLSGRRADHFDSLLSADLFDDDNGLDVAKLPCVIGKKDPVIIEIGANCGQTTLEFMKVFPNAKIFCFEPDPRAIEKFKNNIKCDNVKLIEAAVGSLNGNIDFNQSSGAEWIEPAGWDHSGSIRKPKTHLHVWPWVKFDTKISVPIIMLDDWLIENDIKSIDLIWADVQGAEGDLISGANYALSITDFFYTEFSDDEWYEGQINFETMRALLPAFSVVKKFKNDVLFRRIN